MLLDDLPDRGWEVILLEQLDAFSDMGVQDVRAGGGRQVFVDVAEDAENGRGLVIVDALSKQWSYFFLPGGGKVVYCFLEIR